MDSVVAETIVALEEKYHALPGKVSIEDLVIGTFFTGVKLSGGQGRVAFTPVAEILEAVCWPASAARMPQAGNLDGN